MRTAANVLLVVLAGNAAAQTPSTRQADPAVTAPMVTQQGTGASQRQPAPSRNQFFSPVMGIQIEGPGVTLPTGVAEDDPLKAAAENPPVKPAAVPEPATQK